MSKGQKKPNFFRMLSFISLLIFKRTQKIEITSIPEGFIVDVGGGGEGIIAQIGRERVTAIDKFQSEIDQAKNKAPEANWVLADARKMNFSDAHYDNATSFFSIMYMSTEDKKEVFKEIFRVIKPGGEFWIWDISISKERGVSLAKIKAILPDKTVVRTAYGVSSKKQTVTFVEEMLEDVGFKIEIIENNNQWYFLKAKK